MTMPIKPTISYDEFARADMRIGTIVSADDLEESNKLLRLVVDIGSEKRQIIAGMKKHYGVEDLVGKQIVVIVNLEPRSLAGYESQGMLLAASGEENIPVILLPEKSIVDGAIIK